MATNLAKTGAPDDDLTANRRRAPRAIVEIEATVLSSRGDSAGMTIANVSIHGCNINGPADWLRLGSFVAVELNASEAMNAIVRWVRGESAGLEFLRPVPAGHASWHQLIDSIADM